MTDQELDALLRRVLIDSMKFELEQDVKGCAVSFYPSPQHHRQMKAMLKDPLSWSRKKTRPRWKSIVQKAAMILLIITLGFGTLVVSSPTARAAFVRWVTEWYETHIVYRYAAESTQENVPQYEIMELPEGFVESERTEFPRAASITYENKSGDVIYFNYTFMEQGGVSFFGTEDSDVFDIEVNHMYGQFFESEVSGNLNTITWVDTKQNIQFDISGTYSCIDILHIAESVSLVKTPN